MYTGQVLFCFQWYYLKEITVKDNETYRQTLKIWLIEVSPNGIDMAVHRVKKAYKYVCQTLEKLVQVPV